MDNTLNIFNDWEKFNLRKNRPYINFDFENSELFLKLPTNKDKVLTIKLELENSFYNIKKIINLFNTDDEEFIIHSILNHYDNDLNEITRDYNFLIKKLENITMNENKDKISGTCNLKTLHEIIYASICSDYSNSFQSMNFQNLLNLTYKMSEWLVFCHSMVRLNYLV